MAYDSYKITQNLTAFPSPKTQMLYDKSKQVRYLYDLAIDKEDGCLLNSLSFTESPRVFDRKYKGSLEQVTVETINTADKFYVGDYLTFDNDMWLCTEKINFHSLYCKGIFQRCTYTLKWQNSTGTILSYPCITSNKSFSQDENKVITLGANQKSILLPYDENTSALTIEKRMYVDKRNKTPYKPIGDIDTTTYNYGSKGLIYFVMEQSLSQDNTALPDRPDLGICNYIEPTTPPTPSPSGYIMTITPNMDLTLDSSFWCVFTPTLKDSDGNIITDWVASWTINYNGMDMSKFTIQYVGNTCQVKCTDDTYDIVDLILGLTCSDGTVSASYNATIIWG